MTSTLDGMDRDRYAALRTLLVQEASPADVVRRPVWKRPRFAVGSGLVAAALAVAVVAAVSRPVPAYAVSGGNGKEVKVEVNRLEGAHALEDALRERGITADITYLPDDRACLPGRYVEKDTSGLMLTVSAERFEVEIPAGAVHAGETFVLSASVTPLEGGTGARSSVEFGIAQGLVAPCTAVDVPR